MAWYWAKKLAGIKYTISGIIAFLSQSWLDTIPQGEWEIKRRRVQEGITSDAKREAIWMEGKGKNRKNKLWNRRGRYGGRQGVIMTNVEVYWASCAMLVTFQSSNNSPLNNTEKMENLSSAASISQNDILLWGRKCQCPEKLLSISQAKTKEKPNRSSTELHQKKKDRSQISPHLLNCPRTQRWQRSVCFQGQRSALNYGHFWQHINCKIRRGLHIFTEWRCKL